MVSTVQVGTRLFLRYLDVLEFHSFDTDEDTLEILKFKNGDFSNLQFLRKSSGVLVATAARQGKLFFFDDRLVSSCSVTKNVGRSRGIQGGATPLAAFGDDNDHLRVFGCTQGNVFSPPETVILAYDLSPMSQGLLLTSFANSGTILAQRVTTTFTNGIPDFTFETQGTVEIGGGGIEKIESATSGSFVIAVILEVK